MWSQNRVQIELPNLDATQFYELLKAAYEPLFEGCDEYSKLSAMAQLLNIKSDCNVIKIAYNRFAEFFHNVLPKNNKLEYSYYKTK